MAAIVILGTILAGVILSKSRHTRQLALSRRKSVAAQAADELIAKWWTSPRGVPVNQSGVVPHDDSMSWRTEVVPNQAVEQLEARVVRIEIHESQPENIQTGTGDEALLAVELVLPRTGRKTQPKPKAESDTAQKEKSLES